MDVTRQTERVALNVFEGIVMTIANVVNFFTYPFHFIFNQKFMRVVFDAALIMTVVMIFLTWNQVRSLRHDVNNNVQTICDKLEQIIEELEVPPPPTRRAEEGDGGETPSVRKSEEDDGDGENPPDKTKRGNGFPTTVGEAAIQNYLLNGQILDEIAIPFFLRRSVDKNGKEVRGYAPTIGMVVSDIDMAIVVPPPPPPYRRVSEDDVSDLKAAILKRGSDPSSIGDWTRVIADTTNATLTLLEGHV